MEYKLLIYNMNDRHGSHPLGEYTSVEPFMALNIGDHIDLGMNERLELEVNTHFQITRLEHDFSNKSHTIKVYIGLEEP